MSKFSTKSRAFSLIELLITLSILGLLLVTVLPSLQRYGRINDVNASAETVRELLAEVQSYALNPNPALCPGAPEYVIKGYMLYVPKDGDKSPGDFMPPTNAPGQGTANLCGAYAGQGQISMTTNQYAIIVRAYDPRDTAAAPPDNPTKEHTLGIVRIGSLSSAARFMSPYVGDTTMPRPIMLGYASPSGGVLAGITGNASTFNYFPALGVGVVSGSTTYQPQATAILAGPNEKKYYYITVGGNDSFKTTLFVNGITGQVTSTGAAPRDFQ